MAKKLKKAVVAVPQDLREVEKFIAQIGEKQRLIAAAKTDLNNVIEKLKIQTLVAVEPLEKQISDLFDGVSAFADAHRANLTNDGKKKTITLPTGSFSWRFTPPSVAIRGVNEVLLLLKKMGLERFIRTKEEPDKEAMLKEPDIAEGVDGITISKQEEFVVKPTEIEVEIAKKLKKSVE